jgi:hypothetical protein
MKMIWMLAAAATLAACHRGEDDMGAAPDRGDTTAVTTDTSAIRTTPTDTAAIPTTPSDTSMVPTTPSDTGMAPTTPTDSTAQPGGYDTPVTPSDSTTGNTGTGVDTTGGYANPPSDTGVPSDSGVSPSVDTTSAR